MTVTFSSQVPQEGVVQRKIARKAIADLTGYDTGTVFTVTGDVFLRAWGVVGATAITSTSGTTTLELGTTEDSDALLSATTIDNSDFAATDVWGDTSPTDDAETLGGGNYRLIGGGADIILTRSVDDITAGSLTLYIEWFPASTDGNVVAA